MPPVTTLAPHRIALNASQVPGLAVVLVGSRKDSETYVRSKKKSSVEVGIESFGTELSAEATEEEILKVGEMLQWEMEAARIFVSHCQTDKDRHTCIHAYAHMRARAKKHTRAHTHTRARTCTHMYIHTYIYTHAHNHTLKKHKHT